MNFNDVDAMVIESSMALFDGIDIVEEASLTKMKTSGFEQTYHGRPFNESPDMYEEYIPMVEAIATAAADVVSYNSSIARYRPRPVSRVVGELEGTTFNELASRRINPINLDYKEYNGPTARIIKINKRPHLHIILGTVEPENKAFLGIDIGNKISNLSEALTSAIKRRIDPKYRYHEFAVSVQPRYNTGHSSSARDSMYELILEIEIDGEFMK